MNEKNALLEVSGLKKYFPIKSTRFFGKEHVVKAVDDVSFAVEKGSIMGVIGESGCGKSTMGRTILKLTEPSGGRVMYKGKVLFDVEGMKEADHKELLKMRKEIQMIFQDSYSALDPRQNILKVLSEGVLKHKITDRDNVKEYCEHLLKLCGMDGAALYRFPHEFSGGQRQRIGIARALAVSPEFIVCDEPTAALDVSIQSQILNLMLDLKENMLLTYLFISHNIGVVKHFCDTIAVMYLGRFVETGNAGELCGKPLHPYTQALLSAVPTTNPWDKKERIYLEGSIPGGFNVPEGCRFHTRCRYAKGRCRMETPELVEATPGHFVACHLY